MAETERARGSRGVGVRWTKRMVEAFLDRLAVTCNVKESAAAIGVCYASVYHKRRNDPDFLAQWEGALACGYQLLETRLVGHALAGGTVHGELDPDPGDQPICTMFALRLMTLRRQGQTGGPSHNRPRAIATKAETDAVLLKKLAALETRLKVDA